MKFTPLALPGLVLVEMQPFGDARGFFVERFNEKEFREAGLPTHFAQDSHSRSGPGTVRGLHFQQPAQGKLVGCVTGGIWDVAVDIRPASATYGKWLGVELWAERFNMLWIPAGFAHGFCVLGEAPAEVLYKQTVLYNPSGEGGLSWCDPEIGIQWPIGKPIVSDRDARHPSFAAYRAKPPKWLD